MRPEDQQNQLTVIERQQSLAVRVADLASPEQNTALREWLKQLLELRDSNVSKLKKCQDALSITWKAKVILPVLQLIAKEVKKHGWDNRSKSQRFGMGGAAAAIALFGGKSAGIAALGTAVGVPLWVVVGAGSMFAHNLLHELTSKATAPATEPEVSGPIIDLKAESPLERHDWH